MGAHVTAITMGPPQAKDVLRYALGMGVDEAMLLSDRAFAGSDTLATGYALAGFIASLSPNLVICGSEAIDGCTGQVGPIIAENLGWPQFTYVENFHIEKNEIIVERERKEGYKLLSAKMPAVLCVLKDKFPPRQTVAIEKTLKVFNAQEVGLDEKRLGISGSRTRVVSVSVNNKKALNYVEIDSSLPAEERIRMIINGGIEPKKVALVRGTTAELAVAIFQDAEFKRYLVN
jgi:electron transfer flavoprotein beta subunit